MSMSAREMRPLGQNAARALTDRIKRDAQGLYDLLLDAYEGKAWAVLGYTNWREYCQTEFDMSQSRAYQILDQGRVVLALREASNSTDVEISEAVARDLKPVLDEVTDAVRLRIESGSDDSAEEIIRQEVEKARLISSGKRGARELMDELNPPDFDPEANRQRMLLVEDFKTAIERVIALPPPAEIIAAFRPFERELADQVPTALGRLAEFQTEWRKVNG